MPLDEIQLECDSFDACVNESTGMAAHPDKGVIPVCQAHIEAFGIPLINSPKFAESE